MTKPSPLRVGILGARGIGRVHARIFRAHGADVCAVLGSTRASAAAVASALKREFGIDAKPFFELDRFLAEPLDAVSVCTPPPLHFTHVRAAFDRGLPVFCEKPLLWEAGVLEKLAALESHPSRRLYVNTSNAAFIDAVRSRTAPPDSVRSFSFRFYSHGPHRGRDIAIDLMPHALSLLIRLLGHGPLTSFESRSSDTQYECTFTYGECRVACDLRQGHGGPKELAFRINDREFVRLQRGDGMSYRVSLKEDRTNEEIQIDDPFDVHIGRFLRYCVSPRGSERDEFDEAAANLRLMAQVLAPMRD